MNISASELNKRSGTALEMAIKEPVIIKKSGRPSVVMLSYDRYRELEDYFWGNLSEQNDQVGQFASSEESIIFLKENL
jgi:prevent-host-death family protein